MASTVAGGIFNAFAFAGASWIFSHVDHGNYQAEQKRHDLAVEKLQRDQEEWEREEKKKYDKMQEKRIEAKEATSDLAAGSKALDQYYKLTHQYEDHLREKPSLDYTPSAEFQQYLTGVKVVIIGGCVYIGSKYIF